MTSETENMVLEQLRRIRASQDRMAQDIADMKGRQTSMDQNIGQIQIQIGQVLVQMAGFNGRMDRFDDRLSRIERRLDLVEA